MNLRVVVYSEVVVVIRVMPAVVSGPLSGAVMEQLSGWLADERYAMTTAAQILAVARGLSTWMDENGIGMPGLSNDSLDSFRDDHGPGVAGHVLVAMRVPALRRFLIETGYLPGAARSRKHARPPAGKPAPVISETARRELDEWARWQREIGGIGSGCIRHRRAWVAGLVDSLCLAGDIDWSACDVGALNRFVAQRSAGFSPASRTLIIDATRSLMRWALATGRVERDVAGGILRARATRATLPRGLTSAQVDALMAACSPATVIGVRDRAVITVLWRLGLRAGETASLSLDDIDWAVGRLTVVGKGPRRLTLPIPIDVGEVLIAWLRARPAGVADRALFVSSRAPFCALTSAGISSIVTRRAESAGLGVMHAHRLRHTAAMNVIAAGGSLVEVQELLGHRNAASTTVYALTDLVSLRTLAVPFGQVPR